jgi:hypothetical protein
MGLFWSLEEDTDGQRHLFPYERALLLESQKEKGILKRMAAAAADKKAAEEAAAKEPITGYVWVCVWGDV